jgi:hypothetical protein
MEYILPGIALKLLKSKRFGDELAV